MYGEEIVAGGTYFFAGLLCCLIKDGITHIFMNLIPTRVMSFPGSRVLDAKKTPKTTSIMCLVSSLAATALIIKLLYTFNVQGNRLQEIWVDRQGAVGLWCCLGIIFEQLIYKRHFKNYLLACLLASVFEVLLGISSCSVKCLKFYRLNIKIDLNAVG